MNEDFKLFSNYDENEVNQFAIEHSDSFKDFSRIEGLIIRGHILVERNLTSAIELVIPCKSEFKPEKFNFSQKLIIGNMLGISNNFNGEITALNKLRNQIAHTLQYDENHIKTIISGILGKKADVFNSTENEAQKLGTSISFICGALHLSHQQAKIKLLFSALPAK